MSSLLCLLGLVCLLGGSALFAEDEEEDLGRGYSPSMNLGSETILYDEVNTNAINPTVPTQNAIQAKFVLDDRLQTAENRQFASAIYVEQALDYGLVEDAAHYCQLYPPSAEEFEYQSSCVRASDKSIDVKSRAMEEIGEAATKRFPDRLSGYYVFSTLGSLLNRKGHIHDALRIYKRAIEVVPPHAESMIIQAKLLLAIVYANPLLSKNLQKNALDYNREVIAYYSKMNPKVDDYEYIQLWATVYNLGIALLLNFHDYEDAIAEFQKVIPSGIIQPDDRVFLAYAQAKAGRKMEARETLKSVNWDLAKDPERRIFLKCYTNLTLRLLGDGSSLTDCQHLVSPQPDVLLDITETASKLTLKPEEEARIFGMFYRFFSQHLKPDMQRSLDSSITTADLEREKAESRLKSEKLKNMVLYQNLTYSLIGITCVCALALFLAVRSWRVSRRHGAEMSERRQQLQSIIDNIEEGLVRIVAEGRLQPQVSSHLLHITGGHDLLGKTLYDFLQLTDLQDDAKSIAIQCVEAAIGEDTLAWELNLSNLPNEVKIGGREIALFWQMQTQGDTIHSVLLVMRDVTAFNDLHRQSTRDRESADRMLVYAREILSCNPRSIQMFFAELPGMMEVISKRSADVKKVAHTIKGTARTLGLLDLQNAMHSYEDQLKNPEADWASIIPSVETIVATYSKACEHVLGKNSGASAETLFDLVVMLRPGLEKQLGAAGISLGRFTVDESIRLNAQELDLVREVLLHGLTNAADHGFILPTQQGLKVAPEASFQVAVERVSGCNVLTLRDNGAGLNHQKIQELAAKRNWQPKAGQIWSDFLFQEGVSTASNLSMTSGRGVGLAAIQSAALELSGMVQLLDNDKEQGSLIRLSWQPVQVSHKSA